AVGGDRGGTVEAAEAVAPDVLASLRVDAGDDAELARHVEESVVVDDGGDVGRAGWHMPDELRLRYFTASAGAQGHVGAAAVASAEVEDSVIVNGHRDGEAVRLIKAPELLAGHGIVGLDALAGIHDQLGAF